MDVTPVEDETNKKKEEKTVLEEKTKQLAGKDVFDAFVEVFDDPLNLPTGTNLIRDFKRVRNGY